MKLGMSFLMVGHVLVPLVFLMIIYFIRIYFRPIPWVKLLIIQAVVDLTILPYWIYKVTTITEYSNILLVILTVILTIISLMISVIGFNKQRVSENKKPMLWIYVLIVLYVLILL
ncbi:hypothetical protein [Gemella sanguinis]